MMSDNNSFNIESQAVQTHLTLLQGIINRMANNSLLCKTLCVTLVAGVGAIAAGSEKPKILWISILPILIFCILDTLYLSLEKGYRDKFIDFVKKIQTESLHINDLFDMKPPPDYKSLEASFTAFRSWSVWPFYLVMVIISTVFIILITIL